MKVAKIIRPLSGENAMIPLVLEINTLLQSKLDEIVLNPGYENGFLALDEYSQQMEDYLEALEDMPRTLGKGIKRLRRRQQHFESLTAEADRSAQQFSREGQTKLARAAYARKRVMQLASEAYGEEANLQNDRFLALMDAKLRLEARLTEVTQRGSTINPVLSGERMWGA
jgi:phage shock protein A